MERTDYYPKGANRAILKAAAVMFAIMLIVSYCTNPKPFNHLFDVIFKENLTTKEIVK